ncbi:unnamed protein product, partial [marine sediment metagenome]
LDGTNNWRVVKGTALYGLAHPYGYPEYAYQYASIYGFFTWFGDSIARAFFEDTGSNHNYIRLRIWPIDVPIDEIWYCGNEVSIRYGTSLLAAVKFTGYDLYVWDGSSYTKTDTPWWTHNGWTDLVFDMDWSSKTYSVYWDGNSTPVCSNADFGADYDRLTTLEFNGGLTYFPVDSISINDESTSGGQSYPEDDVNIISPCACDSDEALEGRIPVTGNIWWDRLTAYDLLYCPADPDIDPDDPNNWHIADSCYSTGVEQNGLIGYWDTGS